MKNKRIKYVSSICDIDQKIVKSVIDNYSKSIALIKEPTSKKPPINHPIIEYAIGRHRRGIRFNLYGRPASGKTALAVSISVWKASNREKVLWIDTGYHRPEQFIRNHTIKEMKYINIVQDIELEEILVCSEKYDFIVVDDTFSLSKKTKINISLLSTACSRNSCDLLLITQVRKDIFGSKDLIPETATTNSDVIANIVRSEMIDEKKYRFRYTMMIKGFRGRPVHKNVSFEIDCNGVDIPMFITRRALEASVYRTRGTKIYDGETELGNIRKDISINMRCQYKWMNGLWDRITGG